MSDEKDDLDEILDGIVAWVAEKRDPTRDGNYALQCIVKLIIALGKTRLDMASIPHREGIVDDE